MGYTIHISTLCTSMSEILKHYVLVCQRYSSTMY